MIKQIIFWTLVMIVGPKALHAKSDIEAIGDVTQVVIPAYAFGMAINEPDWTGAKELRQQKLL